MNYEKHYNLLIEKARVQILPKNTYIENHHILPLSLGGSKNKTNIVALTAKQHYIAHALLVKIYQTKCINGIDKTPYYKMLKAFTSMMWRWGNPKQNMRALNYNAKIYETWKKDLIEYYRICNRNWLKSLSVKELEEHNKKISLGLKRHYANFSSVWIGRKHSKETIEKIKHHIELHHPGAGEKNSQFGTIWIYNPEIQQSKKIKQDEEIPDGWFKGKIQNWEKHNQKLKVKESKKLAKQKQKDDIRAKYEEMYLEYKKSGFKAMVEKFNYKYSRPNFFGMCKRYVESYKPK